MAQWVGGLVSGIIGSVLVYLAVTYFLEPMRFSFSYGFPPVSGTYIASYPDHTQWKPENVVVRQVGFSISGEFVSPEDNEQYELSGNVTASRIITYQFRPRNKRRNDYGNGLIKLNKAGDGGEGLVLFLSDDAENPSCVKIVIQRTDNTKGKGTAA